MEQGGGDVRGLIEHVSSLGWYNAVVGQMPWLDYLLERNPIVLKLKFLGRPKAEVAAFVMGFLTGLVAINENPPNKSKSEVYNASERKDLLSKFVSAVDIYQEKIPITGLVLE